MRRLRPALSHANVYQPTEADLVARELATFICTTRKRTEFSSLLVFIMFGLMSGSVTVDEGNDVIDYLNETQERFGERHIYRDLRVRNVVCDLAGIPLPEEY